MLALLYSPALRIQRFNFPPLANGEAITFTVKRGPALDDDDQLTVIPERVNILALRSAPVYAVRFGMGVVSSQLDRPEFTAGPEFEVEVSTPGNGNGNDDDDTTPAVEKFKTIQFDDEGNGQVQTGVFVHHYWGHRSPLLARTWLERLIPTFSLGIPVTKADPLQEILLGLDWELVPGAELNAGVNFAKVDALDDRIRVNGENGDVQDIELKVGAVIPSSLDVSTLVKRKYRAAAYFGIVLNGSLFQTLLDRQR